MKPVRLTLLIALLLGALALSLCAALPASAQEPVYTLTIAGGDNQSTAPGTAFALPLQVTVVDEAGSPVSGAVVTFAAPGSGASTRPATFTATTGADGLAAAAATANFLGGAYTVTASAGAGGATFHLTNSNASFWMPDPLDPGQPQPAAGTPPETAVPGWWWRDTTNQNAIAEHTAGQFTGTVYQPYSATKLKVMVYSSASGSNSVALVGTSSWWLVGPGGGRDEAPAAKEAFAGSCPTFSTKTLKGIVLTGVSQEETWGSQFWRNAFRTNPPAPVYADAAYVAAKAERDAVSTAIAARENDAYGQAWVSGVTNISTVAWGPDGLLGVGSMRQYVPVLPYYVAPDNLLSESATFYLDGVTPLELRRTMDGSAGLMVWMPNQGILIAGDSGRYLPDAGSIRLAGVSIPKRIAVLNEMIGLAPAHFVPAHGTPISGAASVQSALAAQRDALQSIYDQALARINAGDTIDEAAAAVTLPADLAASPYNQELVSTISGIVRNIYHEKLGWFGGETHELAATLTPAAKAAALAGAMGGADNLVAAARNAELNARDLAGAEKALYLAEAAYEAAPDNATARQVYAQALRKNAFLQKSAQVRNYYLAAARSLEQSVADFTKVGDENAVLHFSAADFIQHFSGIAGASLEKIRIPSQFPAAGYGVLTWNGHLVKNSSDDNVIPVSELDGLIFTPAGDWTGTTTFAWTGTSGGTYAELATVTITIAPMNDAPTVSNPLPDVTVDEDALSVTYDLSPVFTDVDGDPLSYTVQSSNPALVAATLDGATLTLDFQAEQHGAAIITVSAADEAGEYGGVWATDDFVVTVSPVNDAPWANGQTDSITAGLPRTFTLDCGDLETARVDLAFAFSGPSVGTLDTSALPSVTYTAPAGYVGPDSFTYTVTDRGDPDGCTAAPCAAALTAQATVTLDVAENAIKGRVYNDANANGSPDEGEAGVAGVTVRLTLPDGSPVAELLTGEDGAYAFNSLLPGMYQVTEVVPAGHVQTTADPAHIDLAPGQAVGGVDFGVVYSADLGVTMTADVNDKTIVYTFVVTNHGPAETLDAALINLRPRGVSYTTIVTTQGACQGGNTVTCQFGTVPAGSSVTVTIQANRTDNKNPIENTVTVSASTFDIALTNNSATTTVE